MPPPNDCHSTDPRFPVALLWHMHQPEYRVEGQFQLPWVYLHGIGAYSDMAAHLEAVEGARAVVNFSPVLLDQIQDYAQRLRGAPGVDAALGDTLLDALRELPPPGEARARIARRCLPLHRSRRTERHEEFRALVGRVSAQDAQTLPDAEFCDLLMWFHLGWLGESLRSDPRAQRLFERREHYDANDRRTMLDLIADAMAALLPRYRALADTGRVELSMTPYHHPLLPLLLDFNSAADNAPGVELPTQPYPDGAERARWHLVEGRRRFTEIFGREPQGCWPSEAALSEATVGLLDELRFGWCASSRSVLAATQAHAGRDADEPFHAWQRPGQQLLCYFRDDGISDRIGFAYKDWHADDAVGDLLHTLEHIAEHDARELVLIALDGENAWEFFADNGSHFLRGMYERLAAHPRLRWVTLAECSSERGPAAKPLEPLRAGSWVHGQLLTWIGHPEKNRAWALLMDARRCYLATPQPSKGALMALGACEGSDWFWWPGAYNPGASVADFDALLRAHLSSLYRALGVTPPDVLSRAFAQGSDAWVESGGTMRPTEDLRAPWMPRSAGVLLDLHALPSATLGPDALRFARLAADAGLRVWQLLPVGPRDAHDNPFQPASAFAGDTSLLVDATADDDEQDCAAFCARERDWLEDWALFLALKHETGGLHWRQWPPPLRDRMPAALDAARERLAADLARERRAQYRFERDWSTFKREVNALGLQLFGDVPLFVADDSADVWARRELFEIGADGRCEAVVGVPPDAFSAEGQWWGYPPYRWSAMEAEDYRWWRRRFEVQARRFDLVRLDHFRGLAGWWRIPADARSAADGAWMPGPGAAAIDAIRPVLHGARLVAEDLGIITEDVVALRESQGIAGMRVLQFAFDGDAQNPHLPQHHAPDSVCYTGTHDNDTTLGWWRSLPEAVKANVRETLAQPLARMPADFVELAWASPAPLSIVPMQDLLGLGSDARTNVPGVAENNWSWRFAWAQIPQDFASTLRERLHAQGRAPAGVAQP